MSKEGPEKVSDLFTQFASLVSAFDGSDTAVLVEKQVQTGLSPRAGNAWLVHAVEFFMDGVHFDAAMVVARALLSTSRGLAAMPDLTAKGTIARVDRLSQLATSGAVIIDQPFRVPFFPPIPIASAWLALYVETNIDAAIYRGVKVEARIHFTTIPIDAKVALEIAETWSQV